MEPTAWFISMVVSKKKRGKFRICMDPKDLNQNLKHKRYQIPSGEEIISGMAVALLHKAWLVTRPLAAQTGWKQQQILCLPYVIWLVLSSCLLGKKVSTWSISQGNGADHRGSWREFGLNRWHHQSQSTTRGWVLEHIWSGTQRANVSLAFRNSDSSETNSQLRKYSLTNEKRTGSQNMPRQNGCVPHYGPVNIEDKFIPDLTAKNNMHL